MKLRLKKPYRLVTFALNCDYFFETGMVGTLRLRCRFCPIPECCYRSQ